MNKCRICDCEDSKAVELEVWLKKYKKMIADNKKIKYFFCKKCGCLQISDFISDYSEYYDDYYDEKRLKAERHVVKDFIFKYMYFMSAKGGWRAKIIRKFNNAIDYSFIKLIDKDDSILDIGCGNGMFLQTCRRLGYKNLDGVDPYGVIDDDAGINFYKSNIENLPIKKYKLISLIHTLEHIDDQEKIMKQCFERLEDDGILVICIPVINDWLWNSFGPSIWSLDAPEHLYLHTGESMKILCQKTGFEIEKWYTYCSFTLWDDKERYDFSHDEWRNSRSLKESVRLAFMTMSERKYIDKRKEGNIATFILKKIDKRQSL